MTVTLNSTANVITRTWNQFSGALDVSVIVHLADHGLACCTMTADSVALACSLTLHIAVDSYDAPRMP